MDAIVKTSDSQKGVIVPTSFEEAERFSKVLAGSQLVPKDYIGKPHNVFVAIQLGAELGLKPMQAVQSIAVINGRPSVWGDAALALVRGSNLLEEFDEDGDEKKATCKIKRKGEASIYVSTFTIEEARNAGLTGKDNWKKYPKRMLQLRARAFALRDKFPDVLMGVYIAVEGDQGIKIEFEDNDTPTGSIEDIAGKVSDELKIESIETKPEEIEAEKPEPEETLSEEEKTLEQVVDEDTGEVIEIDPNLDLDDAIKFVLEYNGFKNSKLPIAIRTRGVEAARQIGFSIESAASATKIETVAHEIKKQMYVNMVSENMVPNEVEL